MKTLGKVICLLVFCNFSGCSFHDGLFSILGDSYSGGGVTRAEKKIHYDAQVEAWSERN